MKKLYLILLFVGLISTKGNSQTYTSNTHAVGLEHNMLFNAHKRYTVSQTGAANLNLSTLFDGKFEPSYTSTAPSITSPTVVMIEGLPAKHVQTGGWVGWSTRYWQAKRFKIEGYDQHSGANVWKVIADYSNTDYSGGNSFIKGMPKGAYTKLKFTFYTTVEVNGRLGVSELFFLHPEATTPYQGLSNSFQSIEIFNKNAFNTSDLNQGQDHITFTSNDPGNGNHFGGLTWKSGSRRRAAIAASREHSDADFVGLSFFTQGVDGPGPIKESMRIARSGNVGIGTSNPDAKLAVNGTVHAKEVRVDLNNWPDYVFENNYKLPSLEEVEKQIKEKGHLSNIPSAEEVEKNGVQLGEMNKKLLEKIEELTLYTIEQEKRIKELEKQQEKIKELELTIKALLKK
ncbi:hypothetical protein ACOSP6_15545 [Tenacibaculum sp. MEBiC06402]|uniref:hypothetical protein n=1 Tax=unclassified Tenacibaculum TaxID=2635139 RepID=UPI003B9DC3C3